ncbi:MAG: helix-turn-helix domain-containing protein [Acidobacteriaceae bacterium]|nr:helix-turn-helix domain-containing protein [Acidobacteriaceae bacterium]MBV9442041.1 helix-turn-helix domain-containing protein [Acidobacteriaceae bacterium]
MAERLGLGERQLRRLFTEHLGASPLAVAQTRRVLFAKQLIQETDMPMTEVAMASGFGSLRRFNEIFQRLFHRPPRALRRKVAAHADAGVALRLSYRPPYDWDSILNYLRERAITGVEAVENGVYRRTVALGGTDGSVEVKHLPQRHSLSVTIRFQNVRLFPAIVSRVRRLFDLGADIGVIEEHLSRDPCLAPAPGPASARRMGSFRTRSAGDPRPTGQPFGGSFSCRATCGSVRQTGRGRVGA